VSVILRLSLVIPAQAGIHNHEGAGEQLRLTSASFRPVAFLDSRFRGNDGVEVLEAHSEGCPGSADAVRDDGSVDQPFFVEPAILILS
jgi:hypothetical protein